MTRPLGPRKRYRWARFRHGRPGEEKWRGLPQRRCETCTHCRPRDVHRYGLCIRPPPLKMADGKLNQHTCDGWKQREDDGQAKDHNGAIRG